MKTVTSQRLRIFSFGFILGLVILLLALTHHYTTRTDNVVVNVFLPPPVFQPLTNFFEMLALFLCSQFDWKIHGMSACAGLGFDGPLATVEFLWSIFIVGVYYGGLSLIISEIIRDIVANRRKKSA